MWIKICGITTPEDAALAVSLGVDAVGINLVPSSRRYLSKEQAPAVLAALRGKLELVGVVANLELSALERLQRELGLDWLQLHGSESPELVSALPRAYKAVGIDDAGDVAEAARFGGERLLVDKKPDKSAPGELGGTGRAFRWELVRELAQARPLILAGGLNPDNVARAIRDVKPFGVDVASGVEAGSPGKKDPERMARFVEQARGALREPRTA